MSILVIYFLPTIIALCRGGWGSVGVINLFLGWTVIGWIIALAMSCGRRKITVVYRVR